MKHPKRAIGIAVVLLVFVLVAATVVVIVERDTTGPGDLAGRIFVRGCRARSGDVRITANPVRFTSLAPPSANPADTSTTSTSTTTSTTSTTSTTTTESTTTLAPDTGSSMPMPTLGTIAPGFTVTTFPGRTTTTAPSTTGVAATGELGPVRLIRAMTKPIEAKVSGSGDHLTFHVTGTTTAQAYALDVQPTGRCAKAHVVFGNGMGGPTSPFGALFGSHDAAPISNLGLVIGGAKLIDISLVAPVFATGTGSGAGDGLEVYSGSPNLITIDGTLRNNWADVDDVPIGGTRLFHWASSASGTTEGEMQMSTTPMGDTCADPPDLVTRGQVEYATGSLAADKTGGMFSVDLTPWTKPQWSPGEGPSDEPGKPPPLGGGAPTTTAKKKTGDPQAPPLQGQTGDPHPHPFEGTYYVRVVPRDGKSVCTGAATNSVTLRIGYPGVGLLGQTTLQVYAGSPGYLHTADNINSYSDEWSLQDNHVRWDDTQQGSRMFRWSSTVDGTTAGEWQLSTGPFPSDCHDPPGLIATGAATFAPGPLGTNVAARPTFTIDVAAVAAKQAVGGTPLSHDLPLYVRVIPHAAGAKACAGSPSQPALLKWAANASQGIPGGGLGTGPETPKPPTAKVNVTITAYQRYQGLAYNEGTYCFVTLADHDVPEGLAAVNDPVGLFATLSGHGSHFSKGEPFCFTPSTPEPSWWQKAVSFVIDAVSFPSKVWELYVEIIPAVLGEVLTSLGIPCSPGDSVGPGNGESKGKPASDKPPLRIYPRKKTA